MAWNLTGSYVETCSCELMCPCNLSFDHGATYDYCRATLAFHIRDGEIDGDVCGFTRRESERRRRDLHAHSFERAAHARGQRLRLRSDVAQRDGSRLRPRRAQHIDLAELSRDSIRRPRESRLGHLADKRRSSATPSIRSPTCVGTNPALIANRAQTLAQTARRDRDRQPSEETIKLPIAAPLRHRRSIPCTDRGTG